MRAIAYPESGQGGSAVDLLAMRALEARTPTHDGYIWPALRADMVTSPNIRERMAEDLGKLLNDRGADAVITTEDYLRLGWTREQVTQHAARAGDLYDLQRSRQAPTTERGAA